MTTEIITLTLSMLGMLLVAFVAGYIFAIERSEWVGLTPEDYNGIFEQARTGEHAAQLAEAKLKQKNGYDS